jgi:hypothetical protein
LQRPADLHDIVHHAAIDVVEIGDGEAVARIELDNALAGRVDAIGPGMERHLGDARIRRRQGGECQLHLVRHRRRGDKREAKRNTAKPAKECHGVISSLSSGFLARRARPLLYI